MTKIAAEKLAADQTVIVRGKVTFSRLASIVDGKELADSIVRQREIGRLYPTDRPHTAINLVDAAVDFADPANPTLEEQFIHERLFTFKRGENQGKTGYSAEDISGYLPIVLEPDPDNPGSHRQVKLEKDLDTGLDVSVFLTTFASKNHVKKGFGIQHIVLHEPVRYYNNNASAEALAARGITVSGPISRVPVDESPAAGNGQGVNVGTDEQGLPTAGPAPTQEQPAQPAAPASAPTPAPTPEPAPAPQAQPDQGQAAETPDERVARLQRELAAAQGQQTPQGQSAFDAGSGGDQDVSPWN